MGSGWSCKVRSPRHRYGAMRRSRHRLPSDWRSMSWSSNFPGVMFSAAGAVGRWIAPFLTFVAVAGMGFLADPAPVGRAPVVRLADAANPLVGMPFYVNPTSAAMRAAQHDDPPSPELTAIANTPQAYWIVPGSSAATVAKYTGDAQALRARRSSSNPMPSPWPTACRESSGKNATT
jgi:cellulase/cellobiase CelA1